MHVHNINDVLIYKKYKLKKNFTESRNDFSSLAILCGYISIFNDSWQKRVKNTV